MHLAKLDKKSLARSIDFVRPASILGAIKADVPNPEFSFVDDVT